MPIDCWGFRAAAILDLAGFSDKFTFVGCCPKWRKMGSLQPSGFGHVMQGSKHLTDRDRPGQLRTDQGRPGQTWTDLDRAGQTWTDQDEPELPGIPYLWS